MKILIEGDSKQQPWWVGLQGSCGHCGEMVELEREDYDLPSLNILPDRVSVQCNSCRGYIVILRPDAPVTATQSHRPRLVPG